MFDIKKIFSSFCALAISLLTLFSTISPVYAGSTPAFTFKDLEHTGSRILLEDVEPGDEFTGMLRVSLMEDVPTLFNLNLSSYMRSDIRDLFSEEEMNNMSLANWMTFPLGDQLLLKGFEVKEFPYTINIPEGVAPGDYNGVLVASILDFGDELKDFGLDEIFNPDEVAMGTRLAIGVGIELLIRIAGEIRPDLNFDDLSYYVADDERLNLRVHYTNNGTTTVSPNANVVISDIFGRRYYNDSFRFSSIGPSQTGDSVIRIDTDDFLLTNGIFNIDVELTYDIFMFNGEDDLLYSSGEGKLRIYALPWYFFLIAVLLIISILSWLFFKNYRFYMLYKSSKEYLVKDRDTLQSVSNKFKVDPKNIIIVNKIKKPYFLEGGINILIPNKFKNGEKKK